MFSLVFDGLMDRSAILLFCLEGKILTVTRHLSPFQVDHQDETNKQAHKKRKKKYQISYVLVRIYFS